MNFFWRGLILKYNKEENCYVADSTERAYIFCMNDIWRALWHDEKGEIIAFGDSSDPFEAMKICDERCRELARQALEGLE
jgi:hypothetical protein